MLIDASQLFIIIALIIGAFNPRAAFAILAGFFIVHHWPIFY